MYMSKADKEERQKLALEKLRTENPQFLPIPTPKSRSQTRKRKLELPGPSSSAADKQLDPAPANPSPKQSCPEWEMMLNICRGTNESKIIILNMRYYTLLIIICFIFVF